MVTDLRYPFDISRKTKHLPFALEKKINKNDFNEHKKKIKLIKYKPHKKLPSDWTDKKKYMIQNWMLKFHVSFGLIVDKVQEVNKFEPSQWLEEYINSNTQKSNQAANVFDENFYQITRLRISWKNNGKCS